LGAVAQQGGHEARAGTDLQHGLVALHLGFLQQAGLDPRGQHALATRQRHLGVHKGQGAVGGGDEVLALDGGQQREHGRIQHIPGADLLFDHVEAGLFDVHHGVLERSGGVWAGQPFILGGFVACQMSDTRRDRP
jgi:hypothetical protein